MNISIISTCPDYGKTKKICITDFKIFVMHQKHFVRTVGRVELSCPVLPVMCLTLDILYNDLYSFYVDFRVMSLHMRLYWYDVKRYRCTHYLRNKNICTSLGAYELNHEGASESDLNTRTRTSTHILFCNKTRVHNVLFVF